MCLRDDVVLQKCDDSIRETSEEGRTAKERTRHDKMEGANKGHKVVQEVGKEKRKRSKERKGIKRKGNKESERKTVCL